MQPEPVNLWWAVPILGIGALLLGAYLLLGAFARFIVASKVGPKSLDLWWLIPFLAIGPIQLGAFLLVRRELSTTEPVLYTNYGDSRLAVGALLIFFVGLFGLGFLIWLSAVICILVWWYWPRPRTDAARSLTNNSTSSENRKASRPAKFGLVIAALLAPGQFAAPSPDDKKTVTLAVSGMTCGARGLTPATPR